MRLGDVATSVRSLGRLDVGDMLRNGATVLHIRDGKVTKYVSYWDRGRARADLSIKE
jgi:ketosteroid isomerase-like protein